MAHFVKLDKNNFVVAIVVVNNSDINDLPFPESEPVGIAFCQNIFGEDTVWRQTSYNSNFRKTYAGLGYIYNPELDIFIEPKPYNSWLFNSTNLNWEPPIPIPAIPEGYNVFWDEDDQEWYTVLKRDNL